MIIHTKGCSWIIKSLGIGEVDHFNGYLCSVNGAAFLDISGLQLSLSLRSEEIQEPSTFIVWVFFNGLINHR